MFSVERRHRGFTLIELLVVLVLIGVIAGVAVLSVGDGGRAEAIRQDARSLVAKLNLLSDEAVLRSSHFGVEINEDGYRFLRYDGEQWLALENDNLLRARELPKTMQLTLLVDGQQARGAASAAALQPDLVFYSSAERTPFELELAYLDAPHLLQRIQGGLLGKVSLQSGEAPQ